MADQGNYFSLGGFDRNLPFDNNQVSNIMDQSLGTTPWSELGAYGKLGAIGEGVGAFSSLANIYAGFKALKLQKSQFKFQKQAWNKNYNNQVKDYENRLKDRWSARSNSASARGGSFASMGNYVGSRALTGQPAGQI
jgi:hypothetical protein